MKIYIAPTQQSTPVSSLLTGPSQLFQRSNFKVEPFTVRSQSKADAILIPHDYCNWREDYRETVNRLARDFPIIVPNLSDSPRIISISNVFSFQHSVPVGKYSPNIIIIPYPIENLTILPRRQFKSIPQVSFVGFVPKVSPRRIWETLNTSPRHPIKGNGAIVRQIGFRRLSSSSLQTNLIRRSHYGGAASLLLEKETFRRIYVDSISNSDLVFCPRGDANSSQRFYEAMSAGRIAIVPETNIRLPKIVGEGSILPKQLIVKTLSGDISEKVRFFWDTLDKDEYNDVQTSLRQMYSNYYNYSSYLESVFSNDSLSSHVLEF